MQRGALLVSSVHNRSNRSSRNSSTWCGNVPQHTAAVLVTHAEPATVTSQHMQLLTLRLPGASHQATAMLPATCSSRGRSSECLTRTLGPVLQLLLLLCSAPWRLQLPLLGVMAWTVSSLRVLQQTGSSSASGSGSSTVHNSQVRCHPRCSGRSGSS